ncbi:P-loop NTPase fold protein [Streptomyces sp. S.PB5]|uniref:P-loop NTPase fold protein n=1 Tax=Streptomyces sp. S.PB5 TaxID=3020844 RepID=UPI0025B1356A|nr:P-loop NTPase fold protein [Streptomyces sp. S.PB5]MDN3028153.1 P-loop NTPase fold protein [Streptomyces sp. S.PB5]
MEFALLNDEPVADPASDLLGTGRAARELARLLHDSRTSTPFTLAVDAGWGMGKSSLMRLVEAELKQGYQDVETVWYNAWTASGADALEGLIKSVLARFDKRRLRRALHHIEEHSLLIRAVQTVLTVVAAPFGAAGIVNRFWRDLSVDAKARNDMREALRDLATQWAESAPHEPRRLLVVFIDDLDRCSEDTVLAVCEAVKVYLDVPGLAFVIGCDRSALGPSGLLRDLGPAGSAFMEKIFQTSYRIPVTGDEDIEGYVRQCAERSGVHELLADETLVRLIAERSARNPRRIKRLINGFGLECSLNPVWQQYESEAVIRTLLLQHLYADFYRTLLASDRGHRNTAEEFLDYRVARRVLGQPAVTPDGESWQTTVRHLAEHGLAAPDLADPDEWGTVLARLEEYLPIGFPALERDQNFVTLVEELLAMPGATELVERLRRGVGPVASVAADEDEGRPRPYAGSFVLWVDDHPDNNAGIAGRLQSLGAKVALAEDARSAERILTGPTRVDLLISDVSRGMDGDAGFAALQRWRESGRYDGPAIFYTARVTPNGEQRSSGLSAEIATRPSELYEYVDSVLTAGRRPPDPATVRELA